MHFYEPMLAELCLTRARDVLGCRSEQIVWVAGVKVATQTPPVRSGRRVVFVTVDDATGPIDATFFEDAQAEFAPTIFHSWLLLIRGHVRRTGPRGVSLRGTGCWDLAVVHQAWTTGGVGAVQALLLPEVGADPSGAVTTGAVTTGRRVLVHASGFRQSPYADTRPAGPDIRRLWHASPGSSG
jgi:error-prone DNA polymerase